MLIYLEMVVSATERSRFETLYLTYRETMYRVALAILKNPQDAEDAVHTAFVCIAENMRKVEKVDSLKTRGYVLTVVRNHAINVYRRKQRHPQSEYVDVVNDGQRQYDGDNELTRCILKLPQRQRDVIILKYCHGYDLKEIANMLDITYQNALKIEQRAKNKLRILCKEEEISC